MSKAAKQSIFILIFLLLGSLGFAGYTIYEKQQLQLAKDRVDQQLSQSQAREQQKAAEAAQLSAQVKEAQAEKGRIETRLREAQNQAQELQGQISKLNEDADRWKERAEKTQTERDGLLSKLNDVNQQLKEAKAAAEKAKEEKPQETVQAVQPTVDTPTITTASITQTDGKSSVGDEQYLASLLKEKASLEVSVDNLKTQLTENSVQMVELKQNNSNLQIELDKLKADREEIDREIKYKTDLVNNLSLELARTKNDKKFVADQLDKLSKDNSQLRDELKRLVSAKGALEKSIVKLTTDKEKVNKKLEASESLIQSKIDEIWEIKDNINATIQSTQDTKNEAKGNQIELPPIVVSSGGENAVAFSDGSADPGFNGKIVSINEDNNFVIVDLGESSGIRIGDTISVFRESKYIARLEIIQVRKDISAADIKDQWSKIKVGDTVK